MPRAPADTLNDDVLYPDDLPGHGLVIRELAFYNADEDSDADELPESARYGWWLPVHFPGDETERWASSPRSLREQVAGLELEEGDVFEVLDAERGPEEHDEWEIEITEDYQP